MKQYGRARQQGHDHVDQITQMASSAGIPMASAPVSFQSLTSVVRDNYYASPSDVNACDGAHQGHEPPLDYLCKVSGRRSKHSQWDPPGKWSAPRPHPPADVPSSNGRRPSCRVATPLPVVYEHLPIVDTMTEEEQLTLALQLSENEVANQNLPPPQMLHDLQATAAAELDQRGDTVTARAEDLRQGEVFLDCIDPAKIDDCSLKMHDIQRGAHDGDSNERKIVGSEVRAAIEMEFKDKQQKAAEAFGVYEQTTPPPSPSSTSPSSSPPPASRRLVKSKSQSNLSAADEIPSTRFPTRPASSKQLIKRSSDQLIVDENEQIEAYHNQRRASRGMDRISYSEPIEVPHAFSASDAAATDLSNLDRGMFVIFEGDEHPRDEQDATDDGCEADENHRNFMLRGDGEDVEVEHGENEEDVEHEQFEYETDSDSDEKEIDPVEVIGVRMTGFDFCFDKFAKEAKKLGEKADKEWLEEQEQDIVSNMLEINLMAERLFSNRGFNCESDKLHTFLIEEYPDVYQFTVYHTRLISCSTDIPIADMENQRNYDTFRQVRIYLLDFLYSMSRFLWNVRYVEETWRSNNKLLLDLIHIYQYVDRDIISHSYIKQKRRQRRQQIEPILCAAAKEHTADEARCAKPLYTKFSSRADLVSDRRRFRAKRLPRRFVNSVMGQAVRNTNPGRLRRKPHRQLRFSDEGQGQAKQPIANRLTLDDDRFQQKALHYATNSGRTGYEHKEPRGRPSDRSADHTQHWHSERGCIKNGEELLSASMSADDHTIDYQEAYRDLYGWDDEDGCPSSMPHSETLEDHSVDPANAIISSDKVLQNGLQTYNGPTLEDAVSGLKMANDQTEAMNEHRAVIRENLDVAHAQRTAVTRGRSSSCDHEDGDDFMVILPGVLENSTHQPVEVMSPSPLVTSSDPFEHGASSHEDPDLQLALAMSMEGDATTTMANYQADVGAPPPPPDLYNAECGPVFSHDLRTVQPVQPPPVPSCAPEQSLARLEASRQRDERVRENAAMRRHTDPPNRPSTVETRILERKVITDGSGGGIMSSARPGYRVITPDSIPDDFKQRVGRVFEVEEESPGSGGGGSPHGSLLLRSGELVSRDEMDSPRHGGVSAADQSWDQAAGENGGRPRCRIASNVSAVPERPANVDIMTEEEQLALALEMSRIDASKY